MSTSLQRRKNVTLWIGNQKLKSLESLPPELHHILDFLQSTLGTTLVSTKILKMPSSSSTNSESWVLELGLRNSSALREKTAGFYSLLRQEIRGLTTSQCLWRMDYIGTRLNSKGNMFYSRLTVVTHELSST